MGGRVLGVRYGKSLSEKWNSEEHIREYEHTETQVVLMDTDIEDEANVDVVPGLTQVGDASTIISGAKCLARDFSEVGPRVWEVECRYAVEEDGPEQSAFDVFKWGWSFETLDEPLLKDAQDGSAIQNSAREPLPPITAPVAVPVLTIKRLESTFSGSTLLAYVNKVNDATFWGAEAGKVLCSGVSADQTIIDEAKVWDVTYTFKFKMDEHGWGVRLLDQGSYYWSGTVGTSTKVPFEAGDATVIGNLDGSGGENTTSTPEFLTYNRYDEADFSTLALDDPT